MRYIPVIVGVAVSLLVGFVASMLQNDSVQNWYPTLNKSSLNPPDAVFPIVWTILYIMMGVSIGLVWMRRSARQRPLTALFAAQLAANFAWSVVFFYLRSPAAALAIILILLALIVVYIQKAFLYDRASAWMFVPYGLWVAFAAYLNLYVVLNN